MRTPQVRGPLIFGEPIDATVNGMKEVALSVDDDGGSDHVGNQFMSRIAVPIVNGMISSTVLTLAVILSGLPG